MSKKHTQMRNKNKGIKALGLIIVTLLVLMGQSCVSPQVSDKTGVQLWGENCTRCHDAPGGSEYTRGQWDVIIKHMRVRSNLTKNESDQIANYLKSYN